jgi:isoaspartyl peptidase/L-asparaginase-like protein (Ntn-hydrolase superfamily)
VKKPRTAIAIHGGAGTISRERLKPRMEARYRAALREALRAGHDVLDRGGTSLDAVTAAVVALEDCPLFNAGHGAVFNAIGEHELDAAVMDGGERRAGAVTCVRTTRNPVLAARAVMEKTRHVMLAGQAADRFAEEIGLAVVPHDYYSTDARRLSLERLQRAERDERRTPTTAADQHGTVGAVALDAAGNLAAATSTGGFTNKMPGRVGDSPVIGAGTYADNETCAVSGTGSGEHFMRAVLAHTVSARIRYLGESLTVAARKALREVEKLGGNGGLVAVDAKGCIAMPFNTEGMYRGCVSAAGEWMVEIYGNSGN